MTIQPFIHCRNIITSQRFYTQVLDFEMIQAPDPDPDACMSRYALLWREGDLVYLSVHADDGFYGNIIFARVEQIETLLDSFLERGLECTNALACDTLSLPLKEQTRGMKEFSVRNPDDNRLALGQPVSH